MNDLDERLTRLSPEAVPSTMADARADLDRGRAARTRRRTRRAGLAAGGLALAAVASYGIVAMDDQQAPANTPRVELVAYTGEQLPGFTVAKVPAGFELQGASQHVLAVARPEATSPIEDFREKLVVTLEAAQPPAAAEQPSPVDRERERELELAEERDGKAVTLDGSPAPTEPEPVGEAAPEGEPVTVAGRPGTIATNSEGTKTLKYDHGDFQVVIQMWPTLGLTDAQLVEFAEGVTVTSAAKPSQG